MRGVEDGATSNGEEASMSETKRGVGRPRTHGSEFNKGLKMGRELHQETQRAAEIDGVPWSEWVRRACREVLKRKKYRT